MKHLGAFFACVVCLALAGVVIYLNHAALVGMPLYVSVGLVLLALCFAVPADFTKAVTTAKDLPGIVSAIRKP